MLSEKQFREIEQRLKFLDCEDTNALFAEVARLKGVVQEFSSRVVGKLATLERDMGLLEKENARLKALRVSADFERDACIGLIAKMASRLGFDLGTVRNHVVLELPAGQVSWDYLDEDAHLFEDLPSYAGILQEQTVKEVYAKVLHPGL